jgi:hypothetical protein
MKSEVWSCYVKRLVPLCSHLRETGLDAWHTPLDCPLLECDSIYPFPQYIPPRIPPYFGYTPQQHTLLLKNTLSRGKKYMNHSLESWPWNSHAVKYKFLEVWFLSALRKAFHSEATQTKPTQDLVQETFRYQNSIDFLAGVCATCLGIAIGRNWSRETRFRL